MIANFESTSMNYPRSQFSKHLQIFRMSYGHCYICTTCATFGTGGKATCRHMDIIMDLL